MAVLNQPPDSQFAYVVLVAKRVRQLMAGGRPLVENPKNMKFTRVAEDEMRKGLLEYEMPDSDENPQEKPRKGD